MHVSTLSVVVLAGRAPRRLHLHFVGQAPQAPAPSPSTSSWLEEAPDAEGPWPQPVRGTATLAPIAFGPVRTRRALRRRQALRGLQTYREAHHAASVQATPRPVRVRASRRTPVMPTMPQQQEAPPASWVKEEAARWADARRRMEIARRAQQARRRTVHTPPSDETLRAEALSAVRTLTGMCGRKPITWGEAQARLHAQEAERERVALLGPLAAYSRDTRDLVARWERELGAWCPCGRVGALRGGARQAHARACHARAGAAA